MSIIEEDKEREERIDFEIVVDAYDEVERAMGWYCYLEDNLNFPFSAKWLSGKKPKGRDVKVINMCSSDDCEHDMFVEVEYEEDVFYARLSDIEANEVDEETAQAISDWKYWVDRGYDF